MRLPIAVKYKIGELRHSTVIICGVFLFAAIGTIILASTHAAPPTSSVEAEAGARTGNVSLVSDSSASGAAAVKFGQSPVGTCPIADRLTINSSNQSSYPTYSIGAQVYVPDGPDPWRDGTDTLGGCFPGPNNTGVPAGTTLGNYVASLPAHNDDPGHLNDNFYFPNEGTCYIKAPNTVIQNQDVNCSLRIRSKNVQIKNSFIKGSLYIDDTWCEGSGNGTSSFTLTDSTVFIAGPTGRALAMCDYTVVRSKVYGGSSTAGCTNCTIKDSYLYLNESSSDIVNGINHNSVVRVGANANLIHNTFQCLVPSYKNTGATSDPTEASGCSANQTAYSHDGNIPHDSTIKRNFYMSTSGGYCGWGGSTSGENNLNDGVHDLRFIENIFSRKKTQYVENGDTGAIGYTSTNCGIFGPMANFYDRPGNTWQCNRWDNGAVFPSPVTNPVYGTNISC
ncbi:hypothetical protein EYC59_05940 [Candidatus Saccharibacteria bacterium]|nr:MAG: hypothetical protein EYC59_05940 [Candidatus Saccharibacteria bacterium]